jgi:hypothetical protein
MASTIDGPPSTRRTKTHDGYRSDRCKQVLQPKGWRSLDDYDYDLETAARLLSLRGVPQGFPFCECGAANFLDQQS